MLFLTTCMPCLGVFILILYHYKESKSYVLKKSFNDAMLLKINEIIIHKKMYYNLFTLLLFYDILMANTFNLSRHPIIIVSIRYILIRCGYTYIFFRCGYHKMNIIK